MTERILEKTTSSTTTETNELMLLILYLGGIHFKVPTNTVAKQYKD